MKKNLILLTVSMVTLTTTNVWAADDAGATGTGNASAKIITPLEIEAKDELKFGTMTGKAGTVTISTAGGRTSTGSNLITDSSNSPQAGKFEITGEKGRSVSVTLPSSTTTVTSGTNSMNVSNYTSNASSGSVTIDSTTGKADLKVGADLSVGENQAAGDYTGTYDVKVTY